MNGESILQVLTAASSAQEKENSKRKTRAGSVPPRSKTPMNSTNPAVPGPSTTGSGRSSSVTPAIRPAFALAASRSAPPKRPKLGEATSASNNVLTVPATRARHTRSTSKEHRLPSPPRTASSKPLPASVQRAASLTMPVPKRGAALTGRVASVQHHRTRGYHPYPQTKRSVSAAVTASAGYAIMGGAALNSSVAAGAAKKAMRARRESFKPRPSIDDGWANATATDGPRRWAGFAGGAVREEDEDF